MTHPGIELVGSTVLKTVQDLRKAGIVAEGNMVPRSLKAQFKSADRSGAKFTVIIGEDEIASRVLSVKDLRSGEQQTVEMAAAAAYFKSVF